MKSKTKLEIIIVITIAILFALGIMIAINASLTTRNKNINNFENENPIISNVSGKIHIINNSGWVDFRNDENCTGSGTYSDPYIIKDLVINAGGSGNGILIENSNVYFKIENCSIYYAEWGSDAGIRLLNVNNSQLIGNDCKFSYLGIDLSSGCYNNTITGNIVSNNGGGIHLWISNNNTISGNTVNNNLWSGIYLLGSNYTIVSENIMNDNNWSGIQLLGSSYTIISENAINNNNMFGIRCEGGYINTISRNTINHNNWSGIAIINSNYNVISGNTANNNQECGIILFESSYITISGNTANYNEYGIFLYNSSYNIISGNNLIENDECIVEFLDCQGNIIHDNECTLMPSSAYVPIILTISFTIVLVSSYIINQNRKRFKEVSEDIDFL
jgi:parallel beta-helix repeat protein